MKAGASLSLQFHKEKDESWYVQSGRAKLELGKAGQGVLDEEVISAGAAFHYEPGTVHRVSALEDTTILEVSSRTWTTSYASRIGTGEKGRPKRRFAGLETFAS